MVLRQNKFLVCYKPAAALGSCGAGFMLRISGTNSQKAPGLLNLSTLFNPVIFFSSLFSPQSLCLFFKATQMLVSDIATEILCSYFVVVQFNTLNKIIRISSKRIGQEQRSISTISNTRVIKRQPDLLWPPSHPEHTLHSAPLRAQVRITSTLDKESHLQLTSHLHLHAWSLF